MLVRSVLTALVTLSLAMPAVASELESAMKTLSTSQDHKARKEAAEALGRLKDPKAIDTLAAALAPAGSDPEADWFVGAAAVKSLVAIGGPKVEKAFRDGLAHENWMVRQRAMRGLAQMKPADVVDVLGKQLASDADYRVRVACAMELGKTKNKAALPHLQKAAKADKDERVRERAANIAERLAAK